ncbi:MAG: DNA cytosine methyltransferase [Balneola sp.]
MKVGSLFSGCGGLDLGFINSGFEILWANDFDKDACKVYRENIGEIIQDDIINIDINQLSDVDVITGGFPCQPFSNAGNRLGTSDERGNLFFETLRFVKRFRPKVVLFENVRGILSIKNKTGNKLINDIVSILENIEDDLGYNVKFKLLKSSDYDVPQNRYRVFIIGIRNDLNIDYHFPSPVIQKDISKLTVSNIILNGNKKGLKNHEHWELSPQQKIMVEHINEGGSWKDVPYEVLPDRFRKIRDNIKKYRSPNFYRRFARNEINGTITAAAQPENCGIIHPIEDRRYSIREIARIQSFPDDFEFNNKSLPNNYKVIGNAVPPKMAEHLANSIKEQIF